MFLSPIFYFGLPAGAEQYEWMLRINPIYHLLVLYRAILDLHAGVTGALPVVPPS